MKRQRSSAFALSHSNNRGARLTLARMTGSWKELAQSIAPRLSRPYGVTRLGKGTAGVPNSALSSGSTEDEELRIRQMRLEAVLLLAKMPMSPRKLSQMAHLADATEARTLVRQLNRTYDARGRAMRVEQVAGGYRLLTRQALAPWLVRLGHLPPTVRLSTPMMETLAVVAYRQPVSRASAEAVRGVACGELLRQLMERDLIRMVGRSEELGRPYLYGTTKRFLQLFGLPNATSLPPIQWQALQDDPIAEDSPLDDLMTSTKEPVVSISVGSVPNAVDQEVHGIAAALTLASDPTSDLEDARAATDEDDELDDDEDWDDEDDDDWDDDDDADELDDDELDDEDDGWEEVDDEDADADDDADDSVDADEDEDEDDDAADDDEDWGEDDDEDWDEADDDQDDDEDKDDEDWE